MPPQRRSDPPKKAKGLLSHVFSFVSKEFESFVLSATASQPESDTRVKDSRRRRGREHLSEDEARHKSRTRRSREVRSKRDLSRLKPRSNPAHDDHQAGDRERSRSPRPPPVFLVPRVPVLRKQPSITMPGALFPRSPSLVPDLMQEPSRGGAGQPSTSEAPRRLSLDQLVSPLRPRSIASVKDAIDRFNATDGAEADFSLMLPSPHSSPAKSPAKTQAADETSPQRPTSPTPISVKGKERARDDTEDEDLNFIVGGSSGVQAKERELVAAREEQREHERRSSGDQSRRASDERERDKRRIRALEDEVRRLKEELSRSQLRASPPPPPPPPPPPLPLRIDTTPCTPTSMFASARASLRHAMTPVEAPINNPGLGRTKRQGQPTVNVPSEKMAAFLQEIKTAKLRRVGSGLNAMGGDGVAGPSGLSKSVIVTTGSASAGPSKLGAKELLRRRSLASLRVPIGSVLAAPVPPSALSASRAPEVRVGLKRKVDMLGVDEMTEAPAKRRMTESLQSSSETGQGNSAPPPEVLSLSDLSLPPRAPPSNETDVTTPSLCSDNDRDENSVEDGAPSTPPGPRSTKKATDANANTRHRDVDVIDVDMDQPSHPKSRVISHEPAPRHTSDMFKKRPPISPIPFPTPRRPSAPARTKRGATPRPKTHSYPDSGSDGQVEASPRAVPVPPVSLIPISKPRPKIKSTLTGKGRPRTSLPQQNGHSSTSASSGSGSGSRNKRKKAHKRRQTLDEELRTAEGRSSDVDQCNDELDLEQEGDVFTATGTKSKRSGFLAHGGGGGVPIFMDVAGAPDSTDEDKVAEAQAAKPSKLASQVSLIPRPKARA